MVVVIGSDCVSRVGAAVPKRGKVDNRARGVVGLVSDRTGYCGKVSSENDGADGLVRLVGAPL